MLAAETPFVDCWASTVYPAIKGDFDRLLKTTPKRIARKLQKQKAKKDEKKRKAATRPQQKKDKTKQEEKDPVHEKISLFIEKAKETGQRRNAYTNLAWAGPIDNTFLQKEIPLGKAASLAADMFWRSLDGAVETAPASQEAAHDVEALPQSKAQRPAEPWQIPKRAQKGFEIPIVITTNWFAEPGICRFERLGRDDVVNADWLANFWAKEEGSSEFATALGGVILDWPFQFIHIQGSSWVEIEQKKCKRRVDDMADCHSTALRNENIEP